MHVLLVGAIALNCTGPTVDQAGYCWKTLRRASQRIPGGFLVGLVNHCAELRPTEASCDSQQCCGKGPGQHYPVFIKTHKVAGSAFSRLIKIAFAGESSSCSFGHCIHDWMTKTGEPLMRKRGPDRAACSQQPLFITALRRPLEQHASFFLFHMMHHHSRGGMPLVDVFSNRDALSALRAGGAGHTRVEATIAFLNEALGIPERARVVAAALEYYEHIAHRAAFPPRWVADYVRGMLRKSEGRSLLLDMFHIQALTDLNNAPATLPESVRSAGRLATRDCQPSRGSLVPWRDVLEVAKRAVDRIDVVLLQERFKDSIALAARKLGVPMPSLRALTSVDRGKDPVTRPGVSYCEDTKVLWVNGTELRSPASSVRQLLDARDMARLSTLPLIAAEEQLYAHAARRFDSEF